MQSGGKARVMPTEGLETYQVGAWVTHKPLVRIGFGRVCSFQESERWRALRGPYFPREDHHRFQWHSAGLFQSIDLQGDNCSVGSHITVAGLKSQHKGCC